MNQSGIYRDLVSGVFGLLFAIYYATASFGYDLGTWRMPGPGFFPFGAALLFGAISLYMIAKALWKATRTESAAGDPASPPDRPRWGVIAQVLAGMVAYALLLERLGFLLCTFLLILFFIRVVAGRRWIYALVMALSVAVGSQFLFNVLLNAQIPNGILAPLWR